MRSRRLELVILIALIATLAFFLRPQRPETQPPAQTNEPPYDFMLMAVGEVPDGLLERMQSHAGPKTVVGIPYLNPTEPAIGKLQESMMDLQIMPQLESQGQVLGAVKIGVTNLPLESYSALMHSLRNEGDGDYSRIAFRSPNAALISTSGMPDEPSLMQLLDKVMANEKLPNTWAELSVP